MPKNANVICEGSLKRFRSTPIQLLHFLKSIVQLCKTFIILCLLCVKQPDQPKKRENGYFGAEIGLLISYLFVIGNSIIYFIGYKYLAITHISKCMVFLSFLPMGALFLCSIVLLGLSSTKHSFCLTRKFQLFCHVYCMASGTFFYHEHIMISTKGPRDF